MVGIAAVLVTGMAVTAQADEKKSYVFCTNTLNNTFQSSMDAKFKELCEANGIEYTCLDPDYDLNKQLSQLSDVANSGYDAAFIIPVDSAGITSGLQEISDAGIPIFNVDTAVIDADMDKYITQFVGTNAFMAGQLVGQQMAKDYPDGGNIQKTGRKGLSGAGRQLSMAGRSISLHSHRQFPGRYSGIQAEK